MQSATHLTPCIRLQETWKDFSAAITPEGRQNKQREMIQLLKDEILAFDGNDAQTVTDLAAVITQHPNVSEELKEH